HLPDTKIQFIRNLLRRDGDGRDLGLAHESTLILMFPLAGIHPVREALRAGLPLDRVLIAKGAAGPRLQELIDLCRERGIAVRFEPRAQLDRAARGARWRGGSA